MWFGICWFYYLWEQIKNRDHQRDHGAEPGRDTEYYVYWRQYIDSCLRCSWVWLDQSRRAMFYPTLCRRLVINNSWLQVSYLTLEWHRSSSSSSWFRGFSLLGECRWPDIQAWRKHTFGMQSVRCSFVDHHLTVRISLCELQQLLICLCLAMSITCISIRLLSVGMYLDG